MMRPYGYELVLDLHNCDPTLFTRRHIREYFYMICQFIGARKCDLHFWDDVGVPLEERQTDPKLKGTTAVQFLLASSIVIHTLDDLRAAYINIFFCGDYDRKLAQEVTEIWFDGKDRRPRSIKRK